MGKANETQYGDLIPSKDMREYLQKIDHHFSDAEIASLIYNVSRLGWEERRERLKDLAERTDDQELKEQILELVEVQLKAVEDFKTLEPGFIYAVETTESWNCWDLPITMRPHISRDCYRKMSSRSGRKNCWYQMIRKKAAGRLFILMQMEKSVIPICRKMLYGTNMQAMSILQSGIIMSQLHFSWEMWYMIWDMVSMES